MKKFNKWIVLIILVLMATLIMVIGCAKSEPTTPKEDATTLKEEPIKLRYGTYYGLEHPESRADLQWIEKIEKETGGRVEIEPYWAGSLVSLKETFEDVKAGVADISLILPGNNPSGFDFHRAEFMLFYYGVPDWETSYRVYHEVHEKYPEDPEWDQVKILARSGITSASPYNIVSVTPIRKLSDLRGKIIKSTGEFDYILKEFGAEPLQMPMAEVYNALQKSILDGALAPYETLKAFNFAEVANYTTILDFRAGIYPIRIMNLDSWNSLPTDIQKVFEESYDFWGQTILEEAEKNDQAGIEFAKGFGHEFIELSPEDLNSFYEVLEELAKKKAKELDSKGFPGTEVLQMTRELIEKNGK